MELISLRKQTLESGSAPTSDQDSISAPPPDSRRSKVSPWQPSPMSSHWQNLLLQRIPSSQSQPSESLLDSGFESHERDNLAKRISSLVSGKAPTDESQLQVSQTSNVAVPCRGSASAPDNKDVPPASKRKRLVYPDPPIPIPAITTSLELMNSGAALSQETVQASPTVWLRAGDKLWWITDSDAASSEETVHSYPMGFESHERDNLAKRIPADESQLQVSQTSNEPVPSRGSTFAPDNRYVPPASRRARFVYPDPPIPIPVIYGSLELMNSGAGLSQETVQASPVVWLRAGDRLQWITD